MKIDVHRVNAATDTTIGIMYVNGQFECFTLEDEPREAKVQGKTRIPAGTYKVKQRKEVSPLTEKYRQRYNFFDFHFELQNVPGFQYIYIHPGNDHTHTDGCILVGNQILSNKVVQKNNLGESAAAFEVLYKKMKAAQEIEITIHDKKPL